MTGYAEGYNGGWSGASNAPLRNTDLWKNIMLKYETIRDVVRVEKVKAHVGIEGNENADKLAVLGMYLRDYRYGPTVLRQAQKAPYKRQLQQVTEEARKRRKKGDITTSAGAKLIPVHKRRLEERKEEQAVKVQVRTNMERNKQRRARANKRREHQVQNDLSAFRQAVKWLSATPEERSATKTCATCGYPGHSTSKRKRDEMTLRKGVSGETTETRKTGSTEIRSDQSVTIPTTT